jgi:uncharacterized protein
MNYIEENLLIETLGLQKLPSEGGFFKQTYKSEYSFQEKINISEEENTCRPVGTAIYYLINSNEFSRLHKLPYDEIFHFYFGTPVVMVNFDENKNTCKEIELGADILSGQRPQAVVPGGVYQGCRLKFNKGFALLGTTMSPGFEFRDLILAKDDLISKFPQFAKILSKYY